MSVQFLCQASALPIQCLRITVFPDGDALGQGADEDGHLRSATGEWEVISRPYMSARGKSAHARVQGSSSQRRGADVGAHERVSVKRAGGALALREATADGKTPSGGSGVFFRLALATSAFTARGDLAALPNPLAGKWTRVGSS